MLEESGLALMTICDEGGGRAALSAAAAVRAGFDDLRVYYLSFRDWYAMTARLSTMDCWILSRKS
jgi:hypothetical protein